jgi:AraC-like DNA-binding protein
LLERDDRSDTPCDAIDLFGDDVAIRGWSPSQAAVRYGEELLGPHYGESPMTALSAQMSAIGLLQEALAEAVPPSDHYAASHLDVGTIARARAARQFMLAHVTAPLSLSDIARATGMSVSTLQRAFRQCYGVSVMGFLRRQRLDHARRRLERDGLSVAEAAAEAGYRTAANFTTAFRRAFGYPPSKQYSFSGKCSRS